MYKLLKNQQGVFQDCVIWKETGAFIPFVDDNKDYQTYLAWVAEGNTAEAAD